MRVLLLHTSYRERGGEDVVVERDAELLREGGHEVTMLAFSNDGGDGLRDKLGAAMSATWSLAAARRVAREVARVRAEVAHVHNFFFAASPSVLRAAREAGAATVLTLHNYRLVCPGGVLLRDGRACELCVGRAFAWPGVRHGCYRGSAAATLPVAVMDATHAALGTWRRDVDEVIVPTEAARATFVGAGIGLDAARVTVRPHAAPDHGVAPGAREPYVAFVGRLSEEKGVRVLLAAAARTSRRVVVVGDGALLGEARAAAARLGNLEVRGALPGEEARAVIARARALVFPSIGRESFGLAVVEALAAGTPVVASASGGPAEIVTEGVDGRLVPPGDAEALARGIEGMFVDDEAHRAMQRAARATYESRYTPALGLASLEAIYARARAHRGAARSG